MPTPRSEDQPMFPFRPVVLGAFIPTLIFETGVGALLPVIPALTMRAGGSLATAAIIAALVPVGKILFDLPAGALSARLGDRLAMMIAGGVATVAFLAAAVSSSVVSLGFAAFLLGAATAVYNLARQAYLTEITPPLRRARVLSTLAGFHRIGLFLGPFLGAAVIVVGSVRAVPWLGVACSGGTVLLLALLGSQEGRAGSASRMDERSVATTTPISQLTVWQLAVRYRGLFVRLGLAVMLVSAARGARQTVIPLWAEHLGLHESTTSLIVGIAGGLDMLLFYPAGKLMDRLGRLWVAVPSMALMACATAAVPLTGTALTLGIVAAVLGFANGAGSGIVMTLGADVAPPDNRARFLSLWRLCQDSGEAAGPLVLSAAAALGSLALGIWLTALAGAGAAGSLARWAPRYSPLANLRSRKPAPSPAARLGTRWSP